GPEALHFRPALAAVRGLEQRARARRIGAFAAGAERPALAAEVPEAGEEDVGVLRVHRHGAAPGGEVRAGEDQVPGLAAVDGLVEPAIRAVAPELAGGAGVDGVAAPRIGQDPGDALGLLQPHVGPALAAVGGLVDAVADGYVVARPRLAGPHPDDLRVLRIDLHRADGLDRLLVEDGLEGGSAILALPDAAARRADEEQCLAVLLAAGDRRDAAAHGGRSDVARLQAGDDAAVDHRAFRGTLLRRRLPDERRRTLRRDDRAQPRPVGKAEDAIVHLDVRLHALHREPLRLRAALLPGLDRGGQPHAVDLGIRAVV